MFRVLSSFLLAMALMLFSGQVHAARIGVASVVKNDVSGSAGGRVRVIKVGSGVFQNEVIATGAASSAQLLFRDETSLTIGANSRLTLDRFVYNPSTRTGDVVVNALQGTFRFVSGSAKPGGYTIKTPVATVGLRGTIVEGYIASDGSLILVVVEGSVVATTTNGQTVTLQAGQFITVSATGVIGGPTDWTGPTLDLDAGLKFIFDSNEPNPNQRRELNDALDSRDLDLTFPPPPSVTPTPEPPPPPPVDNRVPPVDQQPPGTILNTIPQLQDRAQ
ncbi:MAG: FecR domain-containing protein [Hyphomicrobiaceae bacterium]|nr:FecR domain-containing protein [Hyphomicrobiaceae bacterium]